MQKIVLFTAFLLLFFSCKEQNNQNDTLKNETSSNKSKKQVDITYAKGFAIDLYDGYKVLTIKEPWPDTETEFKYALVEEKGALPDDADFDAVVQMPVNNIVVTSTTHIPSLDMLGETKSLVGFPNLSYISSKETRKRIDAGNVKELGKNESINTEVLIDLNPDLVVTFAVKGNNKTVSTIEKTGIPVFYNSDWTEQSPLGKAEWIKFFGAIFNKEQKADSIFKNIETEYLSAKKKAAKATTSPTTLSGAMYKDVWYMPKGGSWGAQFIKDANGTYLWNDTEGTGSLSLNLESVLEKGKDADYWISPGQFSSKQQLKDAHSVYSEFAAYKNNTIYTNTTLVGETGGVIYYELAPNRPDIVLKDIIKILHPEVLPEHELYFFSKLK
ncbi:ABC transporter substrate-binding protein [Marixanthomonas spongiae]|uniref:ABC transporter substrate-binding protein n=1 Tax=Marixanthomonas spongiae TaxID=2174845 RepID=A0A2U0I0V9_9FLAO|nr:ABC transporter substrate-binding protein [Marixanthomonas spongiae]PVW14734.1 ABC transporter substrate-binding protein [Marixanthomonas spongiae]